LEVVCLTATNRRWKNAFAIFASDSEPAMPPWAKKIPRAFNWTIALPSRHSPETPQRQTLLLWIGHLCGLCSAEMAPVAVMQEFRYLDRPRRTLLKLMWSLSRKRRIIIASS
jgi:hypothetical protein